MRAKGVPVASIEPVLAGALAGHPFAGALGREVARVHHRYAAEVVSAFQLCPFLKDPQTGFGRFCVILDRVPDPEACAEVALGAAGGVTHLIFPLVDQEPAVFERFAMQLLGRVRLRLTAPPVIAVFHPRLSGDRAGAHRLVGLLRRAPDPFVQLVPEGLHEGGTVFAGAVEHAQEDHASSLFKRLDAPALDELLGRLEAIRSDRDASYAPLLAQIDASR